MHDGHTLNLHLVGLARGEESYAAAFKEAQALKKQLSDLFGGKDSAVPPKELPKDPMERAKLALDKSKPLSHKQVKELLTDDNPIVRRAALEARTEPANISHGVYTGQMVGGKQNGDESRYAIQDHGDKFIRHETARLDRSAIDGETAQIRYKNGQAHMTGIEQKVELEKKLEREGLHPAGLGRGLGMSPPGGPSL